MIVDGRGHASCSGSMRQGLGATSTWSPVTGAAGQMDAAAAHSGSTCAPPTPTRGR